MIAKMVKNSTLWHNPKEKVPTFTHNRITVVFYLFLAIYGLITCRLCQFIFIKNNNKITIVEQKSYPRFDIVDRNGELLATDIITHSIYVDPKAILDSEETAAALSKVLPMLSKKQILEKLSKKGRFIWIMRHIDPVLKDKIFNLGLSGVFTKEEFKRIYPHGALASHIVGHCDLDNVGICGIERSYDGKLKTKGAVQLSLDLRMQHVVRHALKEGLVKYKANAGNAIIMDEYGQILSAVSLPEYDAFDIKDMKSTFNRNFQGCYEPGSVLKILNVAISLQMNVINMSSTFDATKPVKIGRFTVGDFEGKRRILSLVEAFIHSSNIAMISMANNYGDRYGIDTQRQYFQKLGLLDKTHLEVKELGCPILPCKWTRIVFQTLSYGYGLAMPPISFLKAVAGILTNTEVKPTLLKASKRQVHHSSIFKPQVSKIVEALMREAVVQKYASKVNTPEYYLVGKSGTALQCINGRYDQNSRNTTFISCLIDKHTGRKFFILVMMEGAQAVDGTYGYATASWNCGPVTKTIVRKIAPILGIKPLSRVPEKVI